MNDDSVVVEAQGLVKRYPGTIALKGVDFEVRAGRVNVLIGENGAGKSTLMKLLAGAERPTLGRILVDGREVSFANVREAERAGIGIIFQELNLFPDLSVCENLFIGAERCRLGVIDQRSQHEQARRLLSRVGLELDPATPLGDLYVGQQQLVEIARVLGKQVKVLIMDEPTSALSQHEVEILFGIIAALKREGVAVIYISHRLEEIIRVGDHITVLRNGEVVGVDEVCNIDVPWIVAKMVGAARKAFDYRPRELGEEALRVESLSLKKPNGTLALDAVGFSARRGEILGIYGLMGAGRTELLETLLGLHASARGRIVVDGRELGRSRTARRIERGIALVPEDRQLSGMVQSMSVAENMTLSSLVRWCLRWPGGRVVRPGREREACRRMVERLGIKTADIDEPITSLSGGNMQKVVIAKALLTEPSVLLLDEPTRGVDVGAKAEIYRAMLAVAERGVTVLYTTSELDEALAVADRVLVLSSGRISADLPRDRADRDEIIRKSTPFAA